MTRKKKNGRWRKGDQVPTIPVTVETIMADPAFALGVIDARARLPFHRDYGRWETNRQWDYERGRAWGVLAPREIALRRNGKLNPEAVHWGRRLMKSDIL